MAQDRMWLVCIDCNEGFMLARQSFADGCWTVQHDSAPLDEWLRRHSHHKNGGRQFRTVFEEDDTTGIDLEGYAMVARDGFEDAP